MIDAQQKISLFETEVGISPLNAFGGWISTRANAKQIHFK